MLFFTARARQLCGIGSFAKQGNVDLENVFCVMLFHYKHSGLRWTAKVGTRNMSHMMAKA